MNHSNPFSPFIDLSMSISRDDSVSSVKRSFSDMENNETVEVDSVSVRYGSFPTPVGFHDNYVIAIREKKTISDDDTTKVKPKAISNRSCCIFGCWMALKCI